MATNREFDVSRQTLLLVQFASWESINIGRVRDVFSPRTSKVVTIVMAKAQRLSRYAMKNLNAFNASKASIAASVAANYRSLSTCPLQTKLMEKLKQEEEEKLCIMAEPLQRYLAMHVLPTLTEALIEVAKLRPDDPVDFIVSQFVKPLFNFFSAAFRCCRARFVGKPTVQRATRPLNVRGRR